MHFITIQFKPESKEDLQMGVAYYEVPIGYIKKTIQGAIDIKTEKLKILFKDGRKFKFRRTADIFRFREFKNAIWKLISVFINDSYAFSQPIKEKDEGWSVYNILTEFQRQRIDFKLFYTFKNENYDGGKNEWYINSYPPMILVPIGMSPEEVHSCISYRKEGRMPALTYYFYKKQSSLWRCSQPKSGFLNKNIKENEKLFSLIAKCSKVSGKTQLVILDARPYLNALGNKFKGGGHEVASSYITESNESSLEYQNLDNIKVVKDSYEALLLLCNTPAKYASYQI